MIIYFAFSWKGIFIMALAKARRSLMIPLPASPANNKIIPADR